MGLDVLPSTTKTFEVYSTHDSAIDKASSDLPAYAKTGDPVHLRFFSFDEEPRGRVVFVCRPVPWEDYRDILIAAKGNMAAAAVELFRIGCVAFSNWKFTDDDGELKELRVISEPRIGACDRMSESVFRRVPKAVAVDIGTAIFNKSGLEECLTEWTEELSRAPNEHEKNTSRSHA